MRTSLNTSTSKLTTSLCVYADWKSEWLPKWSAEIKETPTNLHRKLWEWCFIPQALHERGMLRPGKKGLGFAVGQEPLPALFAKYGCQVLATDGDFEDLDTNRWATTNQHANNLAELDDRKLCPPEEFKKLVRFRNVDMNNIPPGLSRSFDFLWSSCAIEHLGTIQAGLNFVNNAMDCLKPGGIAVHTTDFNVSSDTDTLDHNPDVVFRKRDIQWLADTLKTYGHRMTEPDFDPGSHEIDQLVSEPPYTQDPVHLKLRIGAQPGKEHESYVVTSLGIIVQKRPGARDIIERIKSYLERTLS